MNTSLDFLISIWLFRNTLQNLDSGDVIYKRKLFLPNKMKWNINLPTSARVPVTKLCEFCYKDALFRFFQVVYQKDQKGWFWRKTFLHSLKKCKLFIDHINPSNLCRKNVTLLSTFNNFVTLYLINKTLFTVLFY